jgi:hypothetical protein
MKTIDQYWKSLDGNTLFSLLSREYFYRVWIMQGCALSPELVFRLGSLEMDSNWFDSAVYFLALYQRCIIIAIFQPSIEEELPRI